MTATASRIAAILVLIWHAVPATARQQQWVPPQPAVPAQLPNGIGTIAWGTSVEQFLSVSHFGRDRLRPTKPGWQAMFDVDVICPVSLDVMGQVPGVATLLFARNQFIGYEVKFDGDESTLVEQLLRRGFGPPKAVDLQIGMSTWSDATTTIVHTPGRLQYYWSPIVNAALQQGRLGNVAAAPVPTINQPTVPAQAPQGDLVRQAALNIGTQPNMLPFAGEDVTAYVYRVQSLFGNDFGAYTNWSVRFANEYSRLKGAAR